MNCMWQAYLSILPPNLRTLSLKYENTLLETRLRIHQNIEFVTTNGSESVPIVTKYEDLSYVINIASKYSPWSSHSVSQGYITADGGHRIGICGTAVQKNGQITGIKMPTSLCIRVSRDIQNADERIDGTDGSILIIGPPGSGKTTLLRDIIRRKSKRRNGAVCVVDERYEIFPCCNGIPCFPVGDCTDVLYGTSKSCGIEILLRNMTPILIATDEITSQEDCTGLIYSNRCGVDLLCTAHAASVADLYARKIYRPLVELDVFKWLITLKPDKSWKLERMNKCT